MKEWSGIVRGRWVNELSFLYLQKTGNILQSTTWKILVYAALMHHNSVALLPALYILGAKQRKKIK